MNKGHAKDSRGSGGAYTLCPDERRID